MKIFGIEDTSIHPTGRPREPDIGKTFAIGSESHVQHPAAHPNVEITHLRRECRRRSEGRSHRTGSAGQCLVLDAPFIGTHPQQVPPGRFDEIDIHTPRRRETGQVADAAPFRRHVHPFRVLHETDAVGRTGIHEIASFDFGKAARLGHEQLHRSAIGVLRENGCPVHAVRRRERHALAGSPRMEGEKRNAATAVAAHGRLRAVRVEIPHAEIRAAVPFEEHQTVGPHPEAAVAQRRHQIRTGLEFAVPVIYDYEVVARTFVFSELYLHTRKFTIIPVSAVPECEKSPHPAIPARRRNAARGRNTPPGTCLNARNLLRLNDCRPTCGNSEKRKPAEGILTKNYYLCTITDQERFATMIKEIREHRSIRRYRPDAVPQEVMEEVLRAATRASTVGNMQLYSIVVTTARGLLDELASLHLNQPAAATAPAILTFCADIHRFSRWCELRGAEPGYDNFCWFMNGATDALLASQNAALEAEAHGLGICYLGTTLYNAGEIAGVLGLPHGVLPVMALSMGYPETVPPLTDRLPLEAVVHYDTYEDYTPERLDALWHERETSEETQCLLAENGLSNLARIFTERRYAKGDNVAFSRKYFDELVRQGFFNQ